MIVDDIDRVIYNLHDAGISWEIIKIESKKHLPMVAHSTMERFVNTEIAKEKRLMNGLDVLLVVDIEATCWDGKPPEGQENEIIEIGISELHLDSIHVGVTESILVKPEKSKVSQFCTQLTGLTQEVLDTGVGLPAALDILKNKFNSRKRTWASWGEYDKRMFERVCNASKLDYPFGRNHINLKNLFSVVNGLPYELGMAAALDYWKMSLVGRHHCGKDDAFNIALIAEKLLKGLRK
jgi:inhibitor of KinA sporulation pathway (predicted exonuclease)